MKKNSLKLDAFFLGFLAWGFFLLMGPPISLAQTRPIELRFAHFVPTTHSMHVGIIAPWVKDIEKATEGRVRVTIFPAGTLAKPVDLFDATVTGIADFAYTLPAYTPGRLPMSEAPELPFIFSSARHVTETLYALWERFPEFRKEYGAVRLSVLWAGDVGQLFTKKPVRTMADIKGMKIRVHGPMTRDMVLALGGTPITAPIGEVYEMLRRGVIDGVLAPWSASLTFRFFEVTSHVAAVNMYAPIMIWVMNPASFDKLSPTDRKLVDDSLGKKMAIKGAMIYDEVALRAIATFKKAGIPIYEMPEAELDKWRALAEPLYKDWIARMEARGLPGKKFFDEMVRLSKEFAPK